MPFTVPNAVDAATYPQQARLDSRDLDIINATTALTGVLNGCAVTAQGAPNMTVAVAVGQVRINGLRVAVAAGNSGTFTAADSTNPRIDLLTIDTAGAKQIVTGTAAAVPVIPAIPASRVVLARVDIPTSAATITTGQIIDKRMSLTDDVSGHFNVTDYGAIGNGTTDDTAAINAALTAASATSYGSGGGIISFPPGTYKISSVLTINNPAISLVGAGSKASIIQPTSAITGDVIRVQCEISSYVGIQGGQYSQLTIDGVNAGTGAVGLHYGDILGGTLGPDLVVQNFSTTGAIGVRMHNVAYWTERTIIDGLRLWNNKAGIKWDVTAPGTSSFGYTNILSLYMDTNAAQTGFWMAAGTIYNSLINIRGNFSGTGAVYVLISTGVGGAWVRDVVNIQAEASSGTPGTGLSLGASDNIQQCTGFIDLSTGTPANVDSNHFSSFTGHFNCPGISTFAAADPQWIQGRGPTNLGNAFALYANAWSGSGDPSVAGSGPMAYTAAAVGDVFFRTDTTGSVNQRIYTCTVAGTPGTWVAAGISSGAATAAAGSNAGTSPPAPVVAAGSNGTSGSLTFGSGSGAPAIGNYAVVTIPTQAAAPIVVVSAANSATAVKQPYVAASTTTTFTVGLGVAAAVSQGNTVYGVTYRVM